MNKDSLKWSWNFKKWELRKR